MNVLRPLPARAAFAFLALVALSLPLTASAAWYLPRIEIGSGRTNYTPLADFTRLQNLPGSGFAETRVMELESTDYFAVRVDFELHPELRFGWTRSWASTDLRFAIDGTDLVTDDENPRTGQPVAVPSFDVVTDLVSFRWWPEATRWKGMGPTVSLGAGRVSQKQDGDFSPDNQVRVFDWSADDFALLAGVGLEARWRNVRGGLALDVTRWSYEAPDEDVEGRTSNDIRIPRETVLALALGLRVSVGF